MTQTSLCNWESPIVPSLFTSRFKVRTDDYEMVTKPKKDEEFSLPFYVDHIPLKMVELTKYTREVIIIYVRI